MNDWSDFASSDSYKSERDALKRCFQSYGVDFYDSISVDKTQVSDVPTAHDIFAYMPGAAITDNWNLWQTEMQKTCWFRKTMFPFLKEEN
jgi:hypothetical protein